MGSRSMVLTELGHQIFIFILLFHPSNINMTWYETDRRWDILHGTAYWGSDDVIFGGGGRC